MGLEERIGMLKRAQRLCPRGRVRKGSPVCGPWPPRIEGCNTELGPGPQPQARTEKTSVMGAGAQGQLVAQMQQDLLPTEL